MKAHGLFTSGVIMRDFLKSVFVIATGVVLAAFIVVATFFALQPPSHISVDLSKYACGTDLKTVECQRK